MSRRPTHIKLNAPGGIRILWDDGHESVYLHSYLRRHCPCATCGEKPPQIKDETNPFPILGEKKIAAVGASPVGQYAVQFRWNDRHDSGIYTFDYLRSLCPCAQCLESGG